MIASSALAAAAVGAVGAAPPASADPYNTLWKMIPPGYSEGSCQRAAPEDTLDPGAVAYVECTDNALPGGPDVARYVLHRDVDSVNSRFGDILDDTRHFVAKPCPGLPGFPIRWNRQDGTEAGSLACGITEGDYPVVLWTDDSGPMLAWSQGSDLAALFDWWSTVVEPD